MESRVISINLVRENESVYMDSPEIPGVRIYMTNDETRDLQGFFDAIFEEIIQNKKLIQFDLEEGKNDLFYEVASDIVSDLNAEILQSKDEFQAIIALEDQTDQRKD